MQKLLSLVLAVSVSTLAFAGASKPVGYVGGKPVYGKSMPAAPKVLSVKAASEQASGLAKVKGDIAQVCQKKGCWLVLADGDQLIRVMTKHKFFMPKDLRGPAVVYGTLETHTLSEDQAQHMRDDGSKEAKAGSELRMVVDSVQLL
jgi:hypothetical protein